MNKELILEFADYLEHTPLPQGTGFLCRNGQYCCLGVACEFAISKGLPVFKEECRLPNSPTSFTKYDGNSGMLPESVRNFFGFNDPNPGEVTKKNDILLWTFPTIAQYFRYMVKDL